MEYNTAHSWADHRSFYIRLRHSPGRLRGLCYVLHQGGRYGIGRQSCPRGQVSRVRQRRCERQAGRALWRPCGPATFVPLAAVCYESGVVRHPHHQVSTLDGRRRPGMRLLSPWCCHVDKGVAERASASPKGWSKSRSWSWQARRCWKTSAHQEGRAALLGEKRQERRWRAAQEVAREACWIARCRKEEEAEKGRGGQPTWGGGRGSRQLGRISGPITRGAEDRKPPRRATSPAGASRCGAGGGKTHSSGGFKRFFYGRLERSAASEGGSSGRTSDEEEEEEEREPSPFGARGSSRACQDPYQGGGEEEEEKESRGGSPWSDFELQRRLSEHFEGREGGLRLRPRGSNEEEEPRPPRVGVGALGQPHPRCDGAGGAGRCAGSPPPNHRRGQSGQLLCAPHQAPLRPVPTRAEGDVLLSSDAGPIEVWRHGESGRLALSSLHSSTPVHDRSGLGDSPTHGTAQHGRRPGGGSSDGACFEETLSPGRKSAGQGLEQQQLGRKRKREGLAVEKPRRSRRRDERRPTKRTREGQKGKQQRRWWKVGRKSPRLGQVPRQGRGKVNQEALAAAVEPSLGQPHEDSRGAHRGLAETSFEVVLQQCTSLDKCACALSWAFFNAGAVSQAQQNSFFVKSIFNPDVWHRAPRKRGALPIRLGGFAALKFLMQTKTIEEVTTGEFVQEWAARAWEALACFGCNALHEGPAAFSEGPWTKTEKRLASAVAQSVARLASHGQAEHFDMANLEKELLSRRVGYDGEEVGICHALTFDQVLPALPPKEHGGSIHVRNFLSEGTRHWLDFPEKLVLEDTGQVLPKLQGRIHIVAEDVDGIAAALVERGVCQWLPLEEVAEFRGEKKLNGLFGVPKSSRLSDDRPILRLIMNLVPANSVLKQLSSGTKRLPHITSWLSTYWSRRRVAHMAERYVQRFLSI